MSLLTFLLLCMLLTIILYYIIFYRPEQLRAARQERHRQYLRRRSELERYNKDFNNAYFDSLIF